MFYSQIIPDKVIAKLKELKVLNPNEEIVAFYDNTAFLSATKGLLVTTTEVRLYNGKKVISYKMENIKDIIYKEIDKETYLFKMMLITKDNKEIDITPTGIPNDEMSLFIYVINSFRKGR